MDLQLEGKRALITGSTAGIGRAVATMLAAEGAVVVVNGRDRKRCEAAASAINQAGGRAAIAVGDVARQDDTESIAVQAESAIGGVDILVNNVAGSIRDGWSTAQPSDWTAMFQLNVISAVRLVAALAPHMRRQSWGRIIQIGSDASTKPPQSMPGYAASKAALVNMMVSLAKELDGTGITCNVVSPGPTFTEGWRDFAVDFASSLGLGEGLDLEAAREALLAGPLASPSRRLAQPHEVAALVALVASPLGASINGANFRIDGAFTPTVN